MGDAESSGRLRLKKQYIELIPIPDTTSKVKEQISLLVKKCLYERKVNPNADVSEIESRIDIIICKL